MGKSCGFIPIDGELLANGQVTRREEVMGWASLQILKEKINEML
jgi:hypothetical protein